MTESPKIDSLKKRYFSKLIVNFGVLGINLVIHSIVPRALGPIAYGNFHFVTSFFNQVVLFFDSGSSTGFFTKLSRENNDAKLVTFYSYYLFFVIFISVLLTSILVLTPFHTFLWPGQETLYVYLGLTWALMTWANEILIKLCDAQGTTVKVEKARVFQRTFGLVLLVSLFYFDKLNLESFFYYHFIILGLFFLLMVWVAKSFNNNLWNSLKLPLAYTQQQFKYFFTYCHPLFVYSLVGFFTVIFDRWMLQNYSGSAEQGYYGLSYQISTICFLFASAITPLAMREFSIHYGKKDFAGLTHFFERIVPSFFSISAYFCCFILFQADSVIKIIGGDKYVEAITAVSIISIYPIHQSYGQLCSSLFQATDQNKLFRNISVVFMLIGVFLVFLLVAPVSLGGYDLKSTGLAIKMVVVQFFYVNTLLYFCAKYLKISFLTQLRHQFSAVSILLFLSYLVKIILPHEEVLDASSSLILNFIFSGILYSIFVLLVVLFFPKALGLSKDDIKNILGKFRKNK